jgi:hypothetical protein
MTTRRQLLRLLLLSLFGFEGMFNPESLSMPTYKTSKEHRPWYDCDIPMEGPRRDSDLVLTCVFGFPAGLTDRVNGMKDGIQAPELN